MLLLAVASTALAQTPMLKLLSRATVTPDTNEFGNSVAMSSTYSVVGESKSDDEADAAGNVYVFSTTTGAYLRKLRSTEATASDRFGWSVAVSGNRIIVGAIGDDGGFGAAYVFDAATGRQLRKLTADSRSVASFGSAVALHGNLALVGAPNQTTGLGSSTGAAFLFDINTGVQLGRLVASDASSSDFFGGSLALNNSLAVVGARNANSSRGAAYVFDCLSRTELKSLVASDGVAGDQFGGSVSLFGNTVLVGAPNDDASLGSAYLFSTSTGFQLRKLTFSARAAGDRFGTSVSLTQDMALIGMPGLQAGLLFDSRNGLLINYFAGAIGSVFGSSVALTGGNALIGAPQDDSLAFNAGAAFLIQGQKPTRPLTLVATKGVVAPGSGVAKYGTLSAPVVSGSGASAYLSSLTGTGAIASGLWRELSGSSTFVSRDGPGLGVATLSVKNPIHNDDADVVFQSTLRRSSVITALNDTCVMKSIAGAPPSILIQENQALPLAGSAVSAFNEVVQDQDFNGTIGSSIKLKSTVAKRVTVANDSAMLKVDSSGGITGEASEGLQTPIGSDVRYGQFVPRVGLINNRIIWGSALVAGPTTPPGTVTTTTNQALFWQFSSPGLVARSGDTGSIGTKYKTFLAATVSNNNEPTFKVTLSGTGITTANNEAIFRFGVGQIIRKGDPLNAIDYPGVRVSRIIKFWSLPAGQVIFLAGLSGTGVTAANDQALVLFNPFDRLHVLLREATFTEGPDAAKIGTIQKVDVEPVGSQYVVLASLVSSAATNQALFTGRTADFGPSPINPRLARAGMRLRKGAAYDTGVPASSTGVTVKITSMSITTTTDIAGAGAKGLGQAVEYLGNVGLSIDYSNGIRELRSGVP